MARSISTWGLALLIGVGAGLAAGCSDDDDGFCDTYTFQACGGDVVGTWRLSHLCPSSSEYEREAVADDPACADDYSEGSSSVTGWTWTFAGDGSYTMSQTTTFSMTGAIDSECVAAVGQGMTLETFCAAAESQLRQNGATGSCAVTGDECRCRFSGSDAEDSSGTYVAAGTSLVTYDGTFEYCVQGDELHLNSADLGEPEGTLILRRQ